MNTVVLFHSHWQLFISSSALRDGEQKMTDYYHILKHRSSDPEKAGTAQEEKHLTDSNLFG